MTLYAGRAVARLWNRSEHPESALEDLWIPRHVRFVWCQVLAIGLGDGVPSSWWLKTMTMNADQKVNR